MAEIFLCWFCGKRINVGSQLENWVVISRGSGETPERRAHVECAEKAYEAGKLQLGPKLTHSD
jgi:hypothetical protein